jgi:glucose/arabinose dehydrogenase
MALGRVTLGIGTIGAFKSTGMAAHAAYYWGWTLMSLALSLYSASSSALSEITLEPVASGFRDPTFVTHAGDGSGRLFVTERSGKVRIVDPGGRVLSPPFLDLSSDRLNRVHHPGSTGENGLFAIAFHPDYEENGRFFVHYSIRDGTRTGNGIIAEYLVSEDPDVALTEEKILLEIAQPAPNHNGGTIAFNPVDPCTTCLYIGLGDGGGYADPFRNAQNKDRLLGKILRIDVDSGEPYGIPPDNPFVEKAGRDEIFCWGLRNPWRFSFDPLDGSLFVGDVGEFSREEIDIARAGDNLGWSRREGNTCFNGALGCQIDDLTLPIAEYGHSDGNCAVVGGYVYRGSRYPALAGQYFFADYCSGRIWTIERGADGAWSEPWLRYELEGARLLSSFGTDEEGDLLVAQFGSNNGKIYRIVGPPLLESMDLNADGRIDEIDLFELARQYGGADPSEGFVPADLSGDGITDAMEVIEFVMDRKREFTLKRIASGASVVQQRW